MGGGISERARTGQNRRGNNVTMVNTCNLQSKRAMPEKRKQGKKWRGSWKCYLCGAGGMKLHPVFSQSRLLFWPAKPLS